jgi:hypothetical protein
VNGKRYIGSAAFFNKRWSSRTDGEIPHALLTRFTSRLHLRDDDT